MSRRLPAWLVVAACLLGGWWMAQTAPVTGDAVNVEMFYREVIVLHQPLSSFQFSQATFAFPDILAMAAIRTVVPSAAWGLLVYEVLFLGTLAALLFGIYGKIWGGEDAPWTFALGFSVMVLLLCTTPHYVYVALVPGIHGAIELLFLYWVWRLTDFERGDGGGSLWWLALDVVMSCGYAASDMLAVPTVLVPGLLALAWLGWKRRELRKRAGLLIVVNAAAIAAGMAVSATLFRAGIVNARPLRMFAAPWWAELHTAERVAATIARSIGMNVAFAVVIAALAVAVLLRYRRSEAKSRLDGAVHWLRGFLAFSALVLLTNVASILLTARWKDLYSMRYLQDVYYVPLVWLVLWGVPALGLTRRALRASIATVVVAALVVLALLPHRFQQMLPQDLVACLDRHSNELPTPWGFSDYWASRRITFTSRKRIVVDQLTETGAPYIWENSPYAYEQDVFGRTIGRVTFFVATSDKEREAALARWGAPSRTLTCPGPGVAGDVMIYPRGIEPSGSGKSAGAS